MKEKHEEQLNENFDANLFAVEQSETSQTEQGLVENKENMGENEFSSSSIKKFKTVEALEKAYENLEKEFTKKCQKLNELLSENGEKTLPQYKREDWLNKVSDFIANKKFAKNYTKQIAEVLAENEDLSKKEDALSLAYSIVLENNFKTKEELIEDEDFLNNFVYANEKIRNKIIENYLENVASNKTVPLISNFRGTTSISSPKFQPKSLKEAGRYAEQILRK